MQPRSTQIALSPRMFLFLDLSPLVLLLSNAMVTQGGPHVLRNLAATVS
jgi:hypothetical protein